MKNKIKSTILVNCHAVRLELYRPGWRSYWTNPLQGMCLKMKLLQVRLHLLMQDLPELFLHTHLFCLQIISSDEGILPARGGKDWYDGGVFYQLHQHECLSTNAKIRDTWRDLTLLLSRCASAIETLTPMAEAGDASARAFLAEVRGLQAYYNMLCLDLWGIVFQKG